MIAVAVTTLCDFAARSGDIDHRYTPAPSALEGIKGHQAVTGRRSFDYQAELKICGECNGLRLSGRADGYQPSKNRLEEIKTHCGDVSRINPGLKRLHWAQLKTYGALLCREKALPTIQLSLVYYNIVNTEETPELVTFDAAELWQFLSELCGHFHAWALQEQQHRIHRDCALTSLQFPFTDFRDGQRTLSETVYKSLMSGQSLLLEAPTGSGKTIGTLFPALMAMPRQELDRLFYLSSRNTGRGLALDGVKQILSCQTGTVAIRVLEICSREQACLHPDKACHGESCPLANGFYDRLGDARQAAVTSGAILDREAVASIAGKFEICPYYFSQELARWSDLVVADVNYFFDSHAMLYALSQEKRWKTTLLVDEAHNLPDRARGMYSISLSQQKLLALKKRTPKSLTKVFSTLERSWQQLLKAHYPQPGNTSVFLEQLPGELVQPLNRTISAITDYLADHDGEGLLQDILFDAIAFTRLAEMFSRHSICELTRPQRGRAILSIHNLIPSEFLAPRFESLHNAVLFSATLTPYRLYHDLLGLPDSTVYSRIKSPFSQQQLSVKICRDISTRMKDRDHSIRPAVNRIIAQYDKHPGNYLVYLSSFAYLENLHTALTETNRDIPTTRQRPGMTQVQREEFLASFRNGGTQVGFAVLGGVFSEGIDLPGDRLNGVFILTLGLPPHDEFHEILRKRLDQQFGQGYQYTYLYPGMRKVVQAAGRVIRTPTDSGFIELIDDRFTRPEMQALLPEWWPPAQLS